jgi:hypothetical protein
MKKENIVLVSGKPINFDWYVSMVPSVDCFGIRSILRSINIKQEEDLKRHLKRPGVLLGNKWLIWVIVAVFLGLLGVGLVLYWPQVLQWFQGMF